MESKRAPNKSLFIVFVLLGAFFFAAKAAAPAHGKQRLRELAVFPTLSMRCAFQVKMDGSIWWLSDGATLTDDISALKQELKQDPDDVRKLLKLGYLLGQNNQTNESTRAFDYARVVCKSRLASRPQDGVLLTEFGKALLELGKMEEAESVYRKAVAVDSNQWQCWAGLSDFLQQDAYNTLMAGYAPILNSNLTTKALLDYHPPGNALKDSQALQAEGTRCMERAMVLATNDPEAFIQHAGYVGSCRMYDAWLHHFVDGAAMDAKAMWPTTFSPEAAQDLRKAADLSPNDPLLIGAAAFLDFACNVMEPSVGKPQLDKVPDSTGRHMNEALARLQKFSESSDNKIAARALRDIVMIKLMMLKHEDPSFAELAHRAVKLDPTSDEAWNLWLGLAGPDASPTELVSMSEARLKQKDSAFNHLILGKALVKNSKWDEAEAEAETVLLLDPNNITARLMQEAIVIRQSTNDDSLNAAASPINSLQTLLAQLPEGDEKQTHVREFTLNYAIICGLLSEDEYHQKAKTIINDFISKQPDDEDARKIREALE